MKEVKETVTHVVKTTIPMLLAGVVGSALTLGAATTRIDGLERRMDKAEAEHEAIIKIREDVAALKTDVSWIRSQMQRQGKNE